MDLLLPLPAKGPKIMSEALILSTESSLFHESGQSVERIGACWGRLGGSRAGFWSQFLVPELSLSMRFWEQEVHDEEKCES